MTTREASTPSRLLTLAGMTCLLGGLGAAVVHVPSAAADCRRLCPEIREQLTSTTVGIPLDGDSHIVPIPKRPIASFPAPTVPPSVPALDIPPLVSVPTTVPPPTGPKGTIPYVTFPSTSVVTVPPSTVPLPNSSGTGVGPNSVPTTSPRRPQPTTSLPSAADGATAVVAVIDPDGLDVRESATGSSAPTAHTGGLDTGTAAGAGAAVLVVGALAAGARRRGRTSRS